MYWLTKNHESAIVDRFGPIEARSKKYLLKIVTASGSAIWAEATNPLALEEAKLERLSKGFPCKIVEVVEAEVEVFWGSPNAKLTDGAGK